MIEGEFDRKTAVRNLRKLENEGDVEHHDRRDFEAMSDDKLLIEVYRAAGYDPDTTRITRTAAV